jgi:membrane protein implicated in regulation of membrane protease activity
MPYQYNGNRPGGDFKGKGEIMRILLIVGLILLALWLLGLLVIPGLGWLLHIALIIAVILLIIWLLRRVFKLF